MKNPYSNFEDILFLLMSLLFGAAVIGFVIYIYSLLKP